MPDTIITISESLIRDILSRLQALEDKQEEKENLEEGQVEFRTDFPNSPYPNQLVYRTDQNTIFRYDADNGRWR